MLTFRMTVDGQGTMKIKVQLVEINLIYIFWGLSAVFCERWLTEKKFVFIYIYRDVNKKFRELHQQILPGMIHETTVTIQIVLTMHYFPFSLIKVVCQKWWYTIIVVSYSSLRPFNARSIHDTAGAVCSLCTVYMSFICIFVVAELLSSLFRQREREKKTQKRKRAKQKVHKPKILLT